MPSNQAKIKKTRKVIKKLIKVEMFFVTTKRYLGTFIFEKIGAFATKAPKPPEVDSLKNEYTRLPENKNVV